jgi:hypothetical protein
MLCSYPIKPVLECAIVGIELALAGTQGRVQAATDDQRL